LFLFRRGGKNGGGNRRWARSGFPLHPRKHEDETAYDEKQRYDPGTNYRIFLEPEFFQRTLSWQDRNDWSRVTGRELDIQSRFKWKCFHRQLVASGLTEANHPGDQIANHLNSLRRGRNEHGLHLLTLFLPTNSLVDQDRHGETFD